MASGITTFLGNDARKNVVIDGVAGKAKGTYFKSKKPSTYLNHKEKWLAFNSVP
jgi:glutamate 5-kinase